MLSYKHFLACILFSVWLGTDYGQASKVKKQFQIKALEPQTSPAGVCDIRALHFLPETEDVACDRDINNNQATSTTKCRVNGADVDHQDYICDNGLWRLMSGTGQHIRRKRWGWLVTLFVAVVTAVYCDYKDEKYEDWTCSPKQVDPEELVPPSYTYCPPGGDEYTADSKMTSVKVTWSEPQATDDEEVKSNKQTCCGEFKNGDEFPGLPEGRTHYITYTAKDGYNQQATCHFSFVVKYITCVQQDAPDNGRRVSCTHNNIYGSECTYECDDGYELVGSSVSTCQKDKTWSNTPTCQKVLCLSPFSITNGKVTCDDPTYPYDDDCLFTCDEGFKLNGPLKMTCQADQTWSVDASQVSCTDDESPEISCLSPQVFYADRGSFGASVTWIEPTSVDNVDTNPTIAHISGPSQGDVLLEGNHYVIYRATDDEGNSVPALSECTITLEVKVIKCSTGPTDALDVSRFMTYSCSDTSFYNGVSCNLDCDLNLPLDGTDLMTCERNGTTDKGVWSWGSGRQPFCEVVECPAIDAPVNGAYTNDSVNARPLHVMLCQNGYDIPLVGTSFSGRLSCQDSGEWFPLNAFPGCIVSLRPWLALPSDLYYEGDCNDEATQDQIKQNVLDYLSGVQADIDQSICPDPDTCKVENLNVVCGSTSGRRKRRSPENHARSRRQTGYALATFDLMVEFKLGNKSLNDAYLDFLGVLQQISDKLLTDVNNGELDIAGFTLSSDAFQSDFTQVGLACDPGSKIDTGVLKCKPCPPGNYLNASTGNCEACNVGEFMDHEGAVQCDPCPEGYSTLSTGSKSQQKCIKLCSPGYYSSSTMVPCSACPVGQYQSLQGQTACESCPEGTATNTTNSVSIDECAAFDLALTQTTLTADFNANGANVLSMSVWLKLGRGYNSDVLVTITDTSGSILTLNCSEKIVIWTGTSSAFQTNRLLSADHWTHIMGTVDFGSRTLQLYIDEVLVVDETGISVDLSRTISAGEVAIVSNSKGIYISGLVIYNRHLNASDMTSHSLTCAVSANGEMFSMTQFLQNIVDGIAILAPTTCDPVDECGTDPCGNHTCINMVGDFECICHGGMTGDLCDTPPDYCQGQACQHGDCIPGDGTYTCSCTDGYTGVFCDIPPVNGGWTEWSEWSGCSVTCGGGSRVRTRNCTNPVPEYMGLDCVGEEILTESCNDNTCLECPDLKRKPGTYKTCSDNTAAGLQECTMTCIQGKVLPNGQKPYEKYWCGESTNHTWLPLDKTPECVDPTRPDRVGVLFTILYTTPISSSDEASVQSSVEQNLSDGTCVKSGTCDMATSVSAGSRKRRSTSSTLTVEFSVHLTDNGGLTLADYLANGTESSAITELLTALSAINEVIELIQNNTEAIFNVNIGGTDYSVDSSALTVAATVTCEAGYAGADGLCALCAPGTKLNNPICENCDVGTYQPLYGQSTCLPCPAGYTTETYGATDISECSVETAITTTTTAGASSTDGEDEHVDDKDDANTSTIIILVAAMSAVAFMFSIIAISVLVWRKCIRRRFRQNGTAGSLASLSMVRPESDSSRNMNYRTSFPLHHLATPVHPFGASFNEKPPAYDSHGFFHVPPVVKTSNKSIPKTEVLDIVDF